ncbi:MAG: 2,5-diamino-6-(ribosylamino)-4(3H)-pyrimidinone 5'-phosphate reductase [Pleopsidium flavum]|nr:MAG: 2,5-diamino-6-(ribosylamino)-4(3H)-pyrimidinone 5'-phosphate reductase [Pleopsidium flavum]
MDKVKRNSVVMDIAKSEVMKGYMSSSVVTLMKESEKKLAIAGGQHLSRNDVSNTSAAWRQEHPGELVCHEGYEFVKGKGFVKKDDWCLQSILGSPDPSKDTQPPANTLHFPIESHSFLQSYLPCSLDTRDPSLPWVTLTYATSMDSALTLAPGTQTILSGPESKAMTHFLRSRHDAILVGVGTAVADDPGLNCRIAGVGGYGGLGWEGQPRPVIVDPSGRWMLTPNSRILKTVKEGKGRAPWIVIAPGANVAPNRIEMLKQFGGTYLGLLDYNVRGRFRWEAILKALAAGGIKSLMIEGGGTVINELLNSEYADFIDSVIVTVAPTYLGRGGVVVSPERRVDGAGRPKAALRFRDVKWQPLGEDVVMCGKVKAPS